MQRRHLLIGIAATAAGSLLLRPADRGMPHDAYFAALNRLLKTQGFGRPALVIDLDRLERNAARLQAGIAAGKQLRLVAKSLPSLPLLRLLLQRTGSTRVMSFHQPFLNALAAELPATDILLGKPMPVRAAATFYRRLDARGGFNPATQLQWLVDTPERLAQYQQLARTLGTRMRVNIEIDVGLHRGGLSAPEQLDALLATIAADSDHLAFAGVMGYDAHVGKIPSVLESRETSYRKANDTYRAFIERARAHNAQADIAALTFNGAGSPTFRLHGADSPLNDVSVGSALVKPTDFDLDLLADFEPAAFIATPVLKAMDGLHLPGVAALGDAWAMWDRNRQRSYFIYGGKWIARFVSPAGVADNALYGSSSNQAIVNASPAVNLAVDDHVFLRPTQSEAVLLQFGDLLAVRSDGSGGYAIAGHWPVLTPAHDGDTTAATAASGT
jgi:D-serine deaminase-like pyridoxal phosphate-dependent protein